MVHAHQVSLVTRGIIVVFLNVAVICVALGTELCGHEDGEKQTCVDLSMAIGLWNKDPFKPHFYGQYFVFVSSILFHIITLYALVYGAALKRFPHIRSVAMPAWGAVFTLTFAALEGWYSTLPLNGGLPTGTHAYVQSYVAATVFYALCFILFVVDAIANAVLHHD